MARGGYREGAGCKSKWRNGKTRTIRVPIALSERLLEIAEAMDKGLTFVVKEEGRKEAIIDYDTESKPVVIDLSGISVVPVSGQIGVKLSDLVRKGYQIKPKTLSDIVLSSLGAK
jgi:transcription elongation factor